MLSPFRDTKKILHTSSVLQGSVLVVRVTSRFLPTEPIWHLTIIHFSFYFLEINLGRIDPNRLVPNRCNSIASCLLAFWHPVTISFQLFDTIYLVFYAHFGANKVLTSECGEFWLCVNRSKSKYSYEMIRWKSQFSR